MGWRHAQLQSWIIVLNTPAQLLLPTAAHILASPAWQAGAAVRSAALCFTKLFVYCSNPGCHHDTNRLPDEVTYNDLLS